MLLKYQKQKVIRFESESKSSSSGIDEFEYNNEDKNMKAFEEAITGFKTKSILDRNLLYGILSKEELVRREIPDSLSPDD